MVAGAVAAPLLAAALGWMAHAVTAADTANAVLAGVTVAVLAVMVLTLAHFAHVAYYELAELAELDFDERVIEASNGSAGIEHHELTAVLLATRNPLLLLLPLAAVPPLLAGRAAERVLDRAQTSTAEPTRAALNLFQLTTSARLAGELRVSRFRTSCVPGTTGCGARRRWTAPTPPAWCPTCAPSWAGATPTARSSPVGSGRSSRSAGP